MHCKKEWINTMIKLSYGFAPLTMVCIWNTICTLDLKAAHGQPTVRFNSDFWVEVDRKEVNQALFWPAGGLRPAGRFYICHGATARAAEQVEAAACWGTLCQVAVKNEEHWAVMLTKCYLDRYSTAAAAPPGLLHPSPSRTHRPRSLNVMSSTHLPGGARRCHPVTLLLRLRLCESTHKASVWPSSPADSELRRQSCQLSIFIKETRASSGLQSSEE